MSTQTDWAVRMHDQYTHQYPEVVASVQRVLRDISATSHFYDHVKFCYWVGKSNGEQLQEDIDVLDIVQNILIVEFLFRECELLPMVADEAAEDRTGALVEYQEVMNASPWARSQTGWMSIDDESYAALHLFPEVLRDGVVAPLLPKDADQQEYDHVDGFFIAYGSDQPVKKGLTLSEWESWMVQ